MKGHSQGGCFSRGDIVSPSKTVRETIVNIQSNVSRYFPPIISSIGIAFRQQLYRKKIGTK